MFPGLTRIQLVEPRQGEMLQDSLAVYNLAVTRSTAIKLQGKKKAVEEKSVL